VRAGAIGKRRDGLRAQQYYDDNQRIGLTAEVGAGATSLAGSACLNHGLMPRGHSSMVDAAN
jgi:hypothetical protein